MQIAVGRSRKATDWRVVTTTWEKLTKKLASTKVTNETHEEYLAMSKEEQDTIKDVGGFVGGYLSAPRRKAENIAYRTLLTLDMDYGGSVELITAKFPDTELVIYSTHKHIPEKPRLRLVMPLSRNVSREEYEAIGRKVAETIGIELFDDSSYQAERLMYWPSTPKDVEFLYHHQEGLQLRADEVLSQYTDWTNIAEWARSSRVDKIVQRESKKQEDPLAKSGVVGAWCRTYSIEDAIEMLPDVYESVDGGRYSYAGGSTSSGLVLYEGKYAFSHHSTDPIHGQLVNAFDLVRIHKFGDLDGGEQVRIDQKPSYKAMVDFALADGAVKQLLAEEKLSATIADFEEADWLSELETDKAGTPKGTVANVMLILRNDPRLSNSLSRDEFAGRNLVSGRLPWSEFEQVRDWSDVDEACLRNFLATQYHITTRPIVLDCLSQRFAEKGTHPVKQYLEGLAWDKKPRLETLFIDTLGCPDTDLTRAMTRKILCAAVARIYEPGIKFDIMAIFSGAQGLGKSTILSKLGQRWYTDNIDLSRLDRDTRESLRGRWVVEVSELKGLGTAMMDSIKAFTSTQIDRYRAAYGRNSVDVPRTCILIGTTNERGILRDWTGNRRFWVFSTSKEQVRTWAWDYSDIDQVWAEALQLYRSGKEPLFLNAEQQIAMKAEQLKYVDVDYKIGELEEFLETKLPEDWYSRSAMDRRSYFQTDEDLREGGSLRREFVSLAEICNEFLMAPRGQKRSSETRYAAELMDSMEPFERTGIKRMIGGDYGRQLVWERRAD